MALTELKGPFLLTAEGVRIAVTKALPGVYALGHTDGNGVFVMEKVGRSDDNVKKGLEVQSECFSQFTFEYCPSAKAAFVKECDLYHNFMVGTSHVHPARPEASYWKCPHCSVFD